jgi:diacylglycerol O-acyltransferase / wax synthase
MSDMQQLSGLDASMLYAETAQTPNHVAAFYTYDPSSADAEVSFESIAKYVEGRLGLSRTFRRKLVMVPLGLDHPYWVEDADFDLEFHLRQVSLSRPGSWGQLCDLVAHLHARPLDLSRPPWEMYIIEGMGDGVDGIPKNGFATLIKIHHAAVDGLSGLELITVLHDREPDAPPPAGDGSWQPESPPTTLAMLSRAGVNNLLKPMHAVRVARRMAPALVRVPIGLRRGRLQAPPTSMPRTRFNAPVSPHRSIGAMRTPFADVKGARAPVPGSTVNDVVMTIVGGAMRRYLDAKGELPDQSLVALVPISTRTSAESGTGGNRVTMMTATLATHETDPVKRLALVSMGMQEVKDLSNAIGGRTLADLSDAVPGLLLGLGSRAQSLMASRNRDRTIANAAITNVPGPTEPLYFTGARVVGPYGAGPVPHGMGLMHLVSSYAGQFQFSFTADREMVPDPAFYAQCLRESLDELSAAASGKASIPRPRTSSRSG